MSLSSSSFQARGTGTTSAQQVQQAGIKFLFYFSNYLCLFVHRLSSLLTGHASCSPQLLTNSASVNTHTKKKKTCCNMKSLIRLSQTSSAIWQGEVTAQIYRKMHDNHSHTCTQTEHKNNSRSSTAGAFWLAVTTRLLHFGPLYVLDVRLNHLWWETSRAKSV